MSNRTANIIAILIFLLIIFVLGARQIYRWNDCRKVGHTALYCLMDVD